MTNFAVPDGALSTYRGGGGHAICAANGFGAVCSCMTQTWYAGDHYALQAFLADQAQRGCPTGWEPTVG